MNYAWRIIWTMLQVYKIRWVKFAPNLSNFHLPKPDVHYLNVWKTINVFMFQCFVLGFFFPKCMFVCVQESSLLLYDDLPKAIICWQKIQPSLPIKTYQMLFLCSQSEKKRKKRKKCILKLTHSEAKCLEEYSMGQPFSFCKFNMVFSSIQPKQNSDHHSLKNIKGVSESV